MSTDKQLATPWQRNTLRLIPTHPAIQGLADAVEGYAAGMMRGGAQKRLVIVGGPGNGKTSVLLRLWEWHRRIPIAKWPRENRDANTDGFSCEFHDWPDLCKRASKNPEDGRWSDAQECGLLLLDDIGSEADQYKGGEPTSLLRALLGARQYRWTVVSTNVPVANWRKAWDQRVADRLFRDSRVFDLGNCPSFASTDEPKPKPDAGEKRMATDDQLRAWASKLATLRDRLTA